MFGYEWKKWLQTFQLPSRQRRRPARRKPHRTRLQLEPLEDRVTPSATLATDQTDYAPGSTVTFTGSGFQPNEVINISVASTTTAIQAIQVRDDSNGKFTAAWNVGTRNVGATLTATATGESAGDKASATFTDGTGQLTLPTLTTAPSNAVTLGTTSPKLTDSAMLSQGNSPTGTITFTLYSPGNNVVDTETVTVNGNGTYSTPTGYTLPTTGGVTGTYQWDATYSGDANNFNVSDNNNPNERVTISAASPTLTTAAHPVFNPPVPLGTTAPTVSDTATLSGGYHETGSITFTLNGPGGFSYTQTVTVHGNGNYTASTTLPTTGTVAGSYVWTDHYNGDANNNPANEQAHPVPDEESIFTTASPAISTRPSSTSVTLGTTTTTLNDTATLSGGYYETGSITFTLYLGATLVDTETVSVSGNGTYTTPTGYTLPTTGAVIGTYQWDASYSGDANNNAATDNNNPN
jgi:hypothetical protein